MQTTVLPQGRDAAALLVADTVRSHAWFIFTVVSFCGAALLAGPYVAGAAAPSLALYGQTFWVMLLLFVVGFFIGYPVYVMIAVRPRNLFPYIFKDLRSQYLTLERLVPGLLVMLLLPLFISAFTSLKALIPAINPYSWDEFFMLADRALHGGQDPWLWLQPVLGFPAITSGINFFYNLWFFVLFGMVFWQAFSLRDPALRKQFLLTFLLLWIIVGVAAATALSSAGPVYFGRITGLEDPYGPLMAYLYQARESHPLWSLDTQELLWEAYESRKTIVGSGISAMPSMHVATAMLFAFLGWRSHWILGLLLSGFAGIILIGSVHLGWHYALDGYVSILMAWVIWQGAGWWVRARAPASHRSLQAA